MARKTVVVQTGYGIGSAAAVLTSWLVNKSVFWCFLHMFFGWFYVAFACCAHHEAIDAAVHRALDSAPAERTLGP